MKHINHNYSCICRFYNFFLFIVLNYIIGCVFSYNLGVGSTETKAHKVIYGLFQNKSIRFLIIYMDLGIIFLKYFDLTKKKTPNFLIILFLKAFSLVFKYRLRP